MNSTLLRTELERLAQAGMEETSNQYDLERYTRLLDLASGITNAMFALPLEDSRSQRRDELGRCTPKVGADAAIFDTAGRILVTQRVDSGRWCLPGGWMEPHETPAETAVREAYEETGLHVQPLRLVNVFTRRFDTQIAHQATVRIVYLCSIQEGILRCSTESLAVHYWHLNDVPC